MKLVAVFLLVLLIAVAGTAVVTRHETAAATPSLADKIESACKPGYKMYDWSVYSDRLIIVTCANIEKGFVQDQYTVPVDT